MKVYGSGVITISEENVEQVLSKMREKKLIEEGESLQDVMKAYLNGHVGTPKDGVITIDIDADGITYDNDTPDLLGCFAGYGSGSVSLEDDEGEHFKISITADKKNYPDGYIWEDGKVMFQSDIDERDATIQRLENELRQERIAAGIVLDDTGMYRLRTAYAQFSKDNEFCGASTFVPVLTEPVDGVYWVFVYQLMDLNTGDVMEGAKPYYNSPETALMDFVFITGRKSN